MGKSVAVASLVEDFSMYPRNHVDDSHIGDLVRALSSGAVLPPVIVERSSMRIVDGVHRSRAVAKFSGSDATIAVELRDYKNEAELYLDAVRLNSQHGRKLDRHDQTRIVLRLKELNVDPQVIASTLHIPEPDVRTLEVRIVYDTGGAAVPQKRGFEHLRGQTFTDEQIGAMKSVRSGEVGRLCIELIKLLEHELVDYSDAYVTERLEQLSRVLTSALKRHRQAAKVPVEAIKRGGKQREAVAQ